MQSFGHVKAPPCNHGSMGGSLSSNATNKVLCPAQQSECDNLSRVVRELAESRAQLVACRAVQSERIEELQAECMRIMRIADLSRTVSKENITKATQAKKHARQVRLSDEQLLV